MDERKYYLGLDIGTNDIGWALLDQNYKLVKKNGYTLWGVRMFTSSNDAKDRRLYRCGRRRLIRRRQRINWLRDIFTEEIYSVDKSFFERLDDSFLKQEDKRNLNVHNLFVDTYTDREFFEEYPTIFHLRRMLAHSTDKQDIRFVYLALHHIIKYRGNFLTPGDEFRTNDFSGISDVFTTLNNMLVDLEKDFVEDEDYFEDAFGRVLIGSNTFESLQSILVEKRTITDKKRLLKELFDVPNKSIVNEMIIPLLVGGTVNISSRLSLIKNKKYEKCEITLDQENIEDYLEEKKSIIPELAPLFDFCNQIKSVVDYFYIIKLLDDSNATISDAMVRKYNEHQEDLEKLKAFIKTYASDKYSECFRGLGDKNNYARYIGMNNSSNLGKCKRGKHCSRDDFYKYLESIFKTIDDEDAYDDLVYFRDKMANNDLLPRQCSSQNGALPMQLHLAELKMILANQSKYYPFLAQIDNSGVSNSEKIIAIFKYKLPYYVGPLNKNSKYSWVVRGDENITPWNYKDVINLDETAKEFIQRMQNKCTYLKGDNDYCLPKNSLIFSEYNCLSYLNKLSFNGKLIDTKMKKSIFNDVFLTKKKPTKKDIIAYVKSNYGDSLFTTSTTKELPEVNCDMSSYIKFKEIFGNEFEDNKDMIESIIRDIVIFEDKERLEKRLYEIYNLNTEKIKQIKGLNYKEYGRLCMNLLNGLKIANPETGEINSTVLEVMRETNLNLQEILYHDVYRLGEAVDKYNSEYLTITDVTLEQFMDDNIAISPMMKRPIIQSYKIIEEIEKIIKHPIDKFFVECTRTNQAQKKATVSRYKRIKELYATCKSLAQKCNIDLNELNRKLDENEANLKSDAIYLYFTQLGKCLYTMNDIDFSRLSKDYDIDHIYPQSLIKDDSLSNRVLTLKSFNNNVKSDKALFEISDKMPKERYAYYDLLLNAELISKEKYKRLTKKEFTNDELEGFVNRQLVATNQSVKGLIQVLKMYKGVDASKVIFSKAENVSMFRHMFDIYKSRTANNHHHAHDAYLNVVVGDILNNYYIGNHFNTLTDYYRLRSDNKTINPEALFKRDFIMINDKILWDKEIDLPRIKKDIFERFDIHETTRVEYSNDMYGKVTIMPAGTESAIPCKTTNQLSDVKKYGGITSNAYPWYAIIKNTDKKGKEEYLLEAIPKRAQNDVYTYLKSLGYKKFEVMCTNIYSRVTVLQGDLKYCITGKTNEQYVLMNLNDRYFTKKEILTIKKIDKYFDNVSKEIEMMSEKDRVRITYGDDRLEAKWIDRKEIIELIDALKLSYSKNIYSYSVIVKMKESLINYEDKTILELLTLTSQLLLLLKTNERKSADLRIINLSQKSGILLKSKKLEPGTKFISESPTGYYKKVLFEVPK